MTDKEPRKLTAVRLDPDVKERIDTLAAAQERTAADVLRRCLARGLAAEEADQAKLSRRR